MSRLFDEYISTILSLLEAHDRPPGLPLHSVFFFSVSCSSSLSCFSLLAVAAVLLPASSAYDRPNSFLRVLSTGYRYLQRTNGGKKRNEEWKIKRRSDQNPKTRIKYLQRKNNKNNNPPLVQKDGKYNIVAEAGDPVKSGHLDDERKDVVNHRVRC